MKSILTMKSILMTIGMVVVMGVWAERVPEYDNQYTAASG